MFPLMTEAPPRVAELPTCQKTWQAVAPPLRITWRPTVVIKVDSIWKIKPALASPWAPGGRSPDGLSSDDVEVYRPGKRVRPPRFPDTAAPPLRPAALLYAMVRSPWAWAAVGSPKCVVPFTVGAPVSVVPGLIPR